MVSKLIQENTKIFQTEEKRANDVLKNTLYNDKEALDREEREKMERNDEYCRDLQQQLVNRQKQKQCAYEDTLIEKKMLEEVMRTIADEDQRWKSYLKKNPKNKKLKSKLEASLSQTEILKGFFFIKLIAVIRRK